MSLHQGRGNSASTPHPFLISSYSLSSVCLNSREEDIRRGKYPTPMSPSLTLCSSLPPSSLFPKQRLHLLISCPPARKSGSCCLWRLKGLESQFYLRASLVPVSHMTEKRMEPQKDEVEELDY